DPDVPGGQAGGLGAVERLLEERAVAGDREELLGPGLPAARPEPRAAPAGPDHRVPHTWCLGFGVWGLVFMVWCLVFLFGTKHETPNTKHYERYRSPSTRVPAGSFRASSSASRAYSGLTSTLAPGATTPPALVTQSAAWATSACSTVAGESSP